MARRRKQESLLAILVESPWWISAAFAVGSYMAMRWIIPSLMPPTLKPLGAALAAVAWVPAALFGIVAFIALSRSAVESNKSEQLSLPTLQRGRRTMPPPQSRSSLIPGQEWGNSAMSPTGVPGSPIAFSEWTLEALRAIEWKRFELLCGKYYEAAGFTIKTVPFGPDGGIDVKLFRTDSDNPIALVQCKAWNSGQVRVATVRELLGVMTAEKVNRGILVTTSFFSDDAISFARANRIQLLNGPAFLERIRLLSSPAQLSLFEFAFSGDYSTPSCPSCGIKMVRRESKRGPGHGCRNYPKCRKWFEIKAQPST
jgi:restriction system protein